MPFPHLILSQDEKSRSKGNLQEIGEFRRTLAETRALLFQAGKSRGKGDLQEIEELRRTLAESRNEADEVDKAIKMKKGRLSKEQNEMRIFSDGKAFLAVQEIVALAQRAKEKFLNNSQTLQKLCVEPVAVDDLVLMAKNMLDKQEDLVQRRVSGHIGKLRD